MRTVPAPGHDERDTTLTRFRPAAEHMTTNTLLLLRHGKSDWQAGATDDFSRPLAKRGTHNSKRIGQWLAAQALRPDVVLASPAARTLRTATLVCKALDIPPGQIVQDDRIYLASQATLLGVLRELPAGARMAMLVGHNPGLEELLAGLLGDAVPRPEDGKLMPTAALARLELDADWQHLDAGRARLAELVRARHLEER
ncbi:MAG: histidine phosphatase family protein [Gammaproteobacteria bacterium]|jgi:phosphohistidine phosphatase